MRNRHAPMPPRYLRHNRQPQPADARQIAGAPEALGCVSVRVLGFGNRCQIQIGFLA